MLIADAGFDNYNTTITTSQKLAAEKKDVVQRFVTASLEGWSQYLKGGPAIEAANALIKNDNPDMTDDKIAYAIQVMNEKGIVAVGRRADARHRRDDRCPLGALLRMRWRDVGVLPKGVDPKKAYTPRVRQQARRQGVTRRGAQARRRACDRGVGRPAGAAGPRRRQALRHRHAGGAGRRPRHRRRRFPGLLGPSGCGKSTLLRMIARLSALDRRQHRLAGRPRPQAARYRLRLPGADADALGDRAGQCRAAAGARRRAERGRPPTRAAESLARGRAARLRGRLSPRAVGRHAHARLHRPRPGHRSPACC